jgi:hypothetical protein
MKILRRKFVVVTLFVGVLGITVVLGCKVCKEMIKKNISETTVSESSKKTLCCPSANIKLEHLIPIAIGITAGCEDCTEIFIEEAIKNGVPKKKIEEVISIVTSIHQLECFQEAVGPEVVKRMKAPLERAKKILKIR